MSGECETCGNHTLECICAVEDISIPYLQYKLRMNYKRAEKMFKLIKENDKEALKSIEGLK